MRLAKTDARSLSPLALALSALAIAVLSTTTGCAGKGAKPGAASTNANDSDWPTEIIDAHTHTEFTGKPERSSGIPMTEEEYFREFKEAGVVGAVLQAVQGPEGVVGVGTAHGRGRLLQPGHPLLQARDPLRQVLLSHASDTT